MLEALRTKTVRAAALAGMLALGVALSLMAASCGSTPQAKGPSPEELRQIDEEIIRSSIVELFDKVKDGTRKDLNAEVDIFLRVTQLDKAGVEREEFYRVWLGDFDYTIDGLVVEEDSAVARVSMVHRSLDEATDTLAEVGEAYWEAHPEKAAETAEMTEEEIMALPEIREKYRELFMDTLTNTPARDLSLELHFTKDDRWWSMTPESASELFDILYD
ncbi:MAG: hypothetical protein FWG23_07565 [Eggerthellaceae bacterium]|nr:hypothetical protein [Eggerthellaceae bacterium]